MMKRAKPNSPLLVLLLTIALLLISVTNAAAQANFDCNDHLLQLDISECQAMTALLDRLTKLNLIRRAADEKDKRIKRAVLTQKGLDTIDPAIEIRFKEAHEAIAFLDKTERDQLAQLLRKLVLTIPEA